LLCFYRLFVEEELVGLPALEEKEIVEQLFYRYDSMFIKDLVM
jgi:hypothetical protein